MIKYIVRRSLGLLPLLLGIIVISFALMKLAPGGPQAQFNQNPRVTEAQVNAWLKSWCLERQTTPASGGRPTLLYRSRGGIFRPAITYLEPGDNPTLIAAGVRMP